MTIGQVTRTACLAVLLGLAACCVPAARAAAAVGNSTVSCSIEGYNVSCVFGGPGEWVPPSPAVTNVTLAVYGAGGGGGGASLRALKSGSGGGSGGAVENVTVVFVWNQAGTDVEKKLIINDVGAGGSGGAVDDPYNVTTGALGGNGGSTWVTIGKGGYDIIAYGGGGGSGQGDRYGGGGGGSGSGATMYVGGAADASHNGPAGPYGNATQGTPGESNGGHLHAGGSGGGATGSAGADWPGRFAGGVPTAGNGNGGGAAGYNGDGGSSWDSPLAPNSGAGGAGGHFVPGTPATAHPGAAGSDGGVIVEYTVTEADLAAPYGRFVATNGTGPAPSPYASVFPSPGTGKGLSAASSLAPHALLRRLIGAALALSLGE